MYSVETLEGGSLNLVVEEGDTLSGMMSDFNNGNGPSWQWAAERNKLDNADLIHPGQKINLVGSGVAVEAPERRWTGYNAILPSNMENGAYIGRMQTGFKNNYNTMMRAPCASAGCLMQNGNFNISDPYNSAGIGKAMHNEDMMFAGGMVTATGMLGGGWATASTIGTWALGIGEAFHERSMTPMAEPISGSALEHTLEQAGYRSAVAGRIGGIAGFIIGISVSQ